MAWYNPNPISFNADPNIIKSAGAIGDFFQQKAKSDFEQALRTEEAQRAQDALNLQRERAVTQDKQWQQSYDASREDAQTANERWMAQGLRDDMRHADNVKFKERDYTLREKEYKQREAERIQKENELKQAYKSQGLLNAIYNPELAAKMGVTTTTPTYTNPKSVENANSFIQSIAQTPANMSSPQGLNISAQQGGMSVPTIGSQTKYNPTALENFGRVKIPESLDKKEWIDLGGSKVLVDKSGNVHKTISKEANFLDRTKVAQQTVKALDNANGIAPIIGRLIDNYDTGYTGFADTWAHGVAQYTPIGNEKMAQYKADLTNITMFNKELANLGAALTPNEQALLERTLPDPMLDDNLYKARLLNYTRTMRDIVRSKVDSSDMAGYKTKDLSKIADTYDALYQKAEMRFGKPTSNSANKNVRQVVQDIGSTTITPENASNYGIKFNY